MSKKIGLIGIIGLFVVNLMPGLSTKAFSQVEPFAVYEDWKDPEIRTDRWGRGQNDNSFEVKREIQGNRLEMKYRVMGQSTTLQNRLVVKNPKTITQIEADFKVVSLAFVNCADGTIYPYTMVVPALIDLAMFNDGSSRTQTNATGDYFARVLVRREAVSTDPDGMLTVGAYLIRIDTPDGSGVTAKSTIDIGKVLVGEKFTLRIIWDNIQNKLFVGLNDEDTLLSYDKGLNVKPAQSPFSTIRQRMQLGACPTLIEEAATTQVREVRTNMSAVIP